AVSFLMVLASLSVAELLAELRTVRLSPRLAAARLAPATVMLIAALVYGVRERAVYGGPVAGDGRTVAVAQGNVPNGFRWKRAFFGKVLATYSELTSGVAASAPDLIVWPENAVSFYIDREPLLHAQLGEVAALAHEGLLVGAPRMTDDGLAHNSAYLLAPAGATARASARRRPPPLAESAPSRSGVPGAEADAYVPGEPADPLRSATLRLGTVICYEALFPHLVRDLVRRGA